MFWYSTSDVSVSSLFDVVDISLRFLPMKQVLKLQSLIILMDWEIGLKVRYADGFNVMSRRLV